MQLNILYPAPYAVSMLLVIVVEMIVECLIHNDLSDDHGDPRVKAPQPPRLIEQPWNHLLGDKAAISSKGDFCCTYRLEFSAHLAPPAASSNSE